ncbi:MAG TPA: DUF3379 family protein [Rudaea sp.]|nr:DUF3379 family protein [Rudaea sp.]
MNCLEFRRQLGVDPQSASPEFGEHRQQCARCAEAHAGALAFESSLRRALAVPAPAQLADSILLAHETVRQRDRRQYGRRAVLALAASLVLASGIGIYGHAQPLPVEAVGHLRDEAVVLTWTKLEPDSDVRVAFGMRGIALHDIPPGPYTFIGCCPMNKHLTVHLVVQGGSGPVSVIYVVDQRADAREDFHLAGWQGRSIPMGHGTLMLFAQDASRFDGLEQAWRAAIESPADNKLARS